MVKLMTPAVEEIKKSVLAHGKPVRIVFPEGWNDSIQAAALQLVGTNVKPVLLLKSASQKSANIKDLETVVIEDYDLDDMAKRLAELRKAKGLSFEDARKLVSLPNYFGTMLVYQKLVDGYVGGIEMTTKDTVLPALQIVKTEPGAKLVSSVLLMEKEGQTMAFGDCSINAEPTSEQLAEIAKAVVSFAKNVLHFKRLDLAMLSYSTVGSGIGASVDKVTAAVKLLQETPGFEAKVDAEYQFDSAYVPSVRAKKAPKSTLSAGLPANIYVFPNLDSGNIGYKIAQRIGGMTATGPVLTGLAAPINDLSRGATTEDVVGVAYITAAQAIALRK